MNRRTLLRRALAAAGIGVAGPLLDVIGGQPAPASAGAAAAAWFPVDHAINVATLTWAELEGVPGRPFPNNDFLVCADRNGALWYREPVTSGTGWTRFGHAYNVTGLAWLNRELWCTTTDNRLWWRDDWAREIDWTPVGHANFVVGLTTDQGSPQKLYCATSENLLWRRDPVHFEVDWEPLGHANFVTGMASSFGWLICATQDGQFWYRSANAPYNSDWTPWIGGPPGSMTGIAYFGGTWATTTDNQLWWTNERLPV